MVSWYVWHQTKKSSYLGPLSCRVAWCRVVSHICELGFRGKVYPDQKLNDRPIETDNLQVLCHFTEKKAISVVICIGHIT